MTWQDSLRQLDARLAAGEIGAAEYRKTRDEILAEASSGSQSVSFESNTPGAQWQSTPPAQPSPADSDAETTQVVTDETTQVVTADVVTPPPPPLPPQQFGPPQQVPRPAPPIVGPEVFAGARPAGTGRRVLWFVIPLLVIALVGAGVWWFVLRDDSTPVAQNQQQTTPDKPAGKVPETTSAAPVPKAADVADQVPQLPGQAKAESGTMTPDDAQRQQLITTAYAKLLVDGGAHEIVYRKSAGDGYGYLLIAAPVAPAGKAAPALVTSTSDDLRKTGFQDATAGAGQPPVLTRTDQFFRTFVTMYASGDVWVQINVSAAPDGDANALRTEFDNVLKSVLEQLPAR